MAPVASLVLREACLRFDPVFGWSLGSASSRHDMGRFSYPVSVNSLGMRYPEITTGDTSTTGSAYRIVRGFLYLGLRGPDSKRFSDRVEVATGIKILNFGVPSWGPAHYLLKLDAALALHPELVIVAFCLGNDWGNAVSYSHNFYGQPYARLDHNGKVVIKGIPIETYPLKVEPPATPLFRSNPIAWLSAHSRLSALANEVYSLFFDTLTTAEQQEQALGAFRDHYIYAPERYGPGARKLTQHTLHIVRGIFAEIKRRAELAGSKLAILAIPTKCEYSEQCRGEIAQKNHNSLIALRQIAEALKIPLIDPVAQLNLEDFFETDQHWKQSGHRKVAQVLEQWIRENVEVARHPSLPPPPA